MLRIGSSSDWVVGIGSGIIAAALWAIAPATFGIVSPPLRAMLVQCASAVPWTVSVPTLFFAVFGLVSMIQKVGAARAEKSLVAIEQASPSLLDIDIRPNGGVILSRGAMSRQLWVYLRLTNFAPYALRVRQIKIDVWFGQPTLKLSLDHPFELEARSVRNDVGLSAMPDTETIAKIEQYLASEDLSKELGLYVSVVCESDGGALDKADGIHIRPPELSLVVR